MTPGIHLAHKPVGPTSFSIVRPFMAGAEARPGKRALRVCHGGALDPFASGLLLILVEPATRLFDYLHAIPKIYDATVQWGIETDNGDPGGQVTFTGDPSGLSPEQLEDALKPFVGWHEQIPPATSNIRIGGERAYLKAHRGEAVEMPPTRVYLHEARWLEHDLPRQSRLQLVARGGYYIRALARDLGRQLGCGAHLTQLHRSSIGPWNDPGPDRKVEVHGREILPWTPSRILSDQEIGDLRQNKPIAMGEILPPDWPLPAGFRDAESPIRGFHSERLCFLLKSIDDKLQLVTALRGGL